jgi:hypothetical protein
MESADLWEAWCWLFTFPWLPRLLECGNRVAISKGGGKYGKPDFRFPGFPRAVISIAIARLRCDRIAIEFEYYPGLVSGHQSTRDFFRGWLLKSDSSDEEALYRETGTVLSVHLLLHEDSGIRSRRIRHAELFQGIATIGAPDGSDVGSQWFHRAGTGARSIDSIADSSGGTTRFGIGISFIYSSLRSCFRVAGFWLATYPASSY